jgi:hypothetical protein
MDGSRWTGRDRDDTERRTLQEEIMANLSACPKCHRRIRETISSNWFPVHTCRDCGQKYCDDCGDGRGSTCPKCGSKQYSDYDKVYA